MADKEKLHDEPQFTIDLTDEMSDDWLRARRLKLAAEAGDEEAAKELARMEKTQLKKDEGKE